MPITVGRRRWRNIVRTLLQPRRYQGAMVVATIIERPFQFLSHYALGQGTFPSQTLIRTPVGPISLTVNSWHDLRTIHEIFCAGDYMATDSDRVIVDYGSNIGISGAYFLSRGRNSFCYLFEPLPFNIRTLRQNLQRFNDRYALAEVAVGLDDGTCEFGWEPTGRYGGLTQQTGHYVLVEVKKSRRILEDILSRHGEIDILKVDIEGLEQAIVEDLPSKTAKAIRTLYVEHLFTANPLTETHDMILSGSVTRFLRRSST